jgi:hypothetical protein
LIEPLIILQSLCVFSSKARGLFIGIREALEALEFLLQSLTLTRTYT